MTTLIGRAGSYSFAVWLAIVAVLTLAVWGGGRASIPLLALLVAGFGGVILLLHPILGLPVLILASLVVPFQFGTGTAVSLNVATLLIPALFGVWLLNAVRVHRIQLVKSAVYRPLFLFLAANLLSLLIGRATWDPMVPMWDNFLIVQLAQWAIFAFSAAVFLMAGNLVHDRDQLQQITFVFLLVAGVLAVAGAFLGVRTLLHSVATIAVIRAPFWILLTGLAGGQLLFNRRLSVVWKAFLLLVLICVFYYAFFQVREEVANWVGVGAVSGLLIWLRWPRLRWPIAAFFVVLAVSGVFTSVIYNFAGGDQEWQQSGGSRLTLIGRVVEVTMRNPITGLGPAAYRPYANMTPLTYGRAYWIAPVINSHNNYVDLFAHGGLIGLGIFLWFMAETARLAWRLRARFHMDFVAGYVNGMLAVWVSIMVVMLLLDWFLPFIYNVGFAGFQASLLVWLFFGGLVAIENWGKEDEAAFNVDIRPPKVHGHLGEIRSQS